MGTLVRHRHTNDIEPSTRGQIQNPLGALCGVFLEGEGSHDRSSPYESAGLEAPGPRVLKCQAEHSSLRRNAGGEADRSRQKNGTRS